jgi:DNA-binding NarL/FixJ family response regulator
MSIRVLIADDHPLVRDGLRYSIARSGRDVQIVAEAADGLEALALAGHHPVDVFILDITMPRLNGLDTARQLLRKHPAARIIILSLHDTRVFVEEAMAAGARGYLVKETASRNVADAICEVHAGRFYLSPSIAHFLMARRYGGALQGLQSPTSGDLTVQEKKILQMIVQGRTGKEIAIALGRSPNTIKTHRKHLMTKLGVHKQTDLVRFAVQEGITKP